jgi:hypothetical protein
MIIDPNTEFGKKVIFRLNEEDDLADVRRQRWHSQPNPVWFLWDESILIYTRPEYKKVANLRQRPCFTAF